MQQSRGLLFRQLTHIDFAEQTLRTRSGRSVAVSRAARGLSVHGYKGNAGHQSDGEVGQDNLTAIWLSEG